MDDHLIEYLECMSQFSRYLSEKIAAVREARSGARKACLGVECDLKDGDRRFSSKGYSRLKICRQFIHAILLLS